MISNFMNYEWNHSTRSGHPGLWKPRDKKILVLEDDMDMAAFYNRMLKKKFLFEDIQFATTANEALDYLHQNSFDLMISDILLPNLVSGVDLWYRIQSSFRTPTLFVSSLPADQYLTMFKESINPPPFLKKPFTENECRMALQRFMLNP